MHNLIAQVTMQREGSYQAISANGDVTLNRHEGQRLLTNTRFHGKVRWRQQDGELILEE